MKLYKTTLIPQSHFATTLKGDTLFGQLCWSIAHTLGSDRLTQLLENYDISPFLVVSDALAPGYLPKPSLPGSMLGESADDKKRNRKRIWLKEEVLTEGRYTDAMTDKELGNDDELLTQVHNSLNYKSFNTDGELFSPYSSSEFRLTPKEVYCLIDEACFSLEELQQAFELMGTYGFGKESSIGKGRYSISVFEAASLQNEGRTFMTLGPAVLVGGDFKACWYDTFVRFGKHGAARAHTNAFKRPLLMADCAAVVQYDASRQIDFIGKAVKGVSPAYPDTVHQGYAIVTAIKEVE